MINTPPATDGAAEKFSLNFILNDETAQSPAGSATLPVAHSTAPIPVRLEQLNASSSNRNVASAFVAEAGAQQPSGASRSNRPAASETNAPVHATPFQIENVTGGTNRPLPVSHFVWQAPYDPHRRTSQSQQDRPVRNQPPLPPPSAFSTTSQVPVLQSRPLTNVVIDRQVAAYMHSVESNATATAAIRRRFSHSEPLSIDEESTQIKELATVFPKFVSDLGLAPTADAFSIRNNNDATRLLVNCAHTITLAPSPERVAVDNFIVNQTADGSAASEVRPEVAELDTVNMAELHAYGAELHRVTLAADNTRAGRSASALTHNRDLLVNSEKSHVHKFIKGFIHIQPVIVSNVSTNLTRWTYNAAVIAALTQYQQAFTSLDAKTLTSTNRFIDSLRNNRVKPPVQYMRRTPEVAPWLSMSGQFSL